MRVSYFVTATGLDSVEGAPLHGVVVRGTASFDVPPEQLSELPSLRRWVRRHGGAVATESGSPAPAETIDDSGLYAMSLGTKAVSAEFVGYRRDTRPCLECGLPVVRIAAEPVARSRAAVPSAHLTATNRAAWLGDEEALEHLRRAGLDAGLSSNRVRLSGGERFGMWPDRMLASQDLTSAEGARRCTTCLRLVTDGSAPAEWVPRYSMGLFVEPPGDPTGWWWHARLGQHLPIVSGRVAAWIVDRRPHSSALPVIVDEVDAFLPEENRGE